MAVAVEALTELDSESIAQLQALVPQLSRSASVPTGAELSEIVSSPATTLLAARDGSAHPPGPILGSLVLVVFRIPTGVRAWIEDVVVAETARGQGIGEALNREAIRRAELAGARNVDLTSRPDRDAANRLYRRIGFVMRRTNVYRFDLGEADARRSSSPPAAVRGGGGG